AATGSDGRIYAIGGYNGTTISSAVYAYTPPVASATQQTSLTVANGTLSINTLQGSVAFGTLRPGVSSGAIAAGEIDYTNTLADGSAWSATVAATDLVSGSTTVPFTAMTYSPGQTVSPQTGASGNPAPATNSSAFSGSDPTPGTSLSTPVTLVNGASTDQGSFAQTGSTVTLAVPVSTQALT
ncbi:integrins alpha chain, partial [mine drainage metagenome]